MVVGSVGLSGRVPLKKIICTGITLLMHLNPFED